MMRYAGRVLAAVLFSGLAAPAFAADRPADAIVKDIEAIKQPSSRTEMMELGKKKSELIGELLKSHPDEPRLKKYLTERWIILTTSGKADEALREMETASARSKDDAFKLDTAFLKAQIAMFKARGGGGDAKAALAAVEAFAAMAPKDDRTPALLFNIVGSTEDSALKTKLEDRILKDYGSSDFAGMIKGVRKQKDGVGKPFELTFTDAIKGASVSMKDLKGKVVVVDFWATWCGPCVAEMPTMKKLYAEFKDKGVEFIGVSLDRPGAGEQIKKFVADKGITWPQYYELGDGKGGFATSWGIAAIPTVFVVDQDGNLYSTEARGKLEKMIPELLARKGKPTAGAGGR